MIALFSDVTFSLITYFTGVSNEYSANYASIERIGKKPLLQLTGFSADTYTLEMLFNAQFCDPQAEINKLKGILSSGQSGSLILSNGTFAGTFVCESLSVTSTQMTITGELVQATVTAKLKESPSLPMGDTATDIAKHPADKLSDKPKLTDDGKGMTIAKALATARTAMTSVNKAIQMGKALQSGNPLRVLGQMPALASGALKAADAFGVALPFDQSDLKDISNITKASSNMIQIGQLAQGANINNLPNSLQAMQNLYGDADKYASASSTWWSTNIARAVARQ